MASDQNIPSNDAQFDLFQKHFVTGTTANPDRFGITANDVAALTAEKKAWEAAYAGHLKAHQDADAATQQKEVVRNRFETVLRTAVQKVHATAGTDNGLRAAVGLPPRSMGRSLAEIPTTCPLARIETKNPHTLILHFVDEATPQKLAKPDGIRGCEIFFAPSDSAPADPTDFTFLALDTRTPYTHEFSPTDAGKTITYALRWQNNRGDHGPFGKPVTAKVPV